LKDFSDTISLVSSHKNIIIIDTCRSICFALDEGLAIEVPCLEVVLLQYWSCVALHLAYVLGQIGYTWMLRRGRREGEGGDRKRGERGGRRSEGEAEKVYLLEPERVFCPRQDQGLQKEHCLFLFWAARSRRLPHCPI
jgi:hypothetical protein